jgi:hypothetical protein
MYHMAKRTSVYLSDDLEAAVKASGLPLAAILRRGLGLPDAPAPLGIRITADERMLPGAAALVAPDHDGKLQVQVFQTGTLKPGDTVSLSASGSYTAEPVAVSLADALKASLTARREPVAVTLTEVTDCPHHPGAERVHGPGAGWYCGECGTNLPAPVAEQWSEVLAEPGFAGELTDRVSAELTARAKPCKHPHALKGWCKDCKSGGHY